ncbi:RagB/SusD family nutrient uptake outer membrane protein [Parasediminibacterium sp. JCM 36343]|uniref:RagB/SusD family nutrient uptake outer membrane protein n=1 Tax=Parasediminibacterium sp. JCM 36343 TaxID=3374279 RepID=UPI003978BC5C
MACSKFLDRTPEKQMTKEEAIKTDSNLISFIYGAYTLVGNDEFFGGRLQEVSDLLGDQLNGSKFTGDEGEIFRRQNSIFGGTRDDLYKKAYAIINRANVTLESLSLADSNKNFIQGSAFFLRGMAHFEMVRLLAQPYGYSPDNSHLGIPLRVNTIPNSLLRSTVKQVYDQVISDLKAADSLLPTAPLGTTKYYTATKYAAEAYLAKVYFQMNDFANAYLYANKVISSNKFQLDMSYSSRYDVGVSTEGILVLPNQTIVYNPGSELRGKYRSDKNPPSYNYTDQFFNHANAKPGDVRQAWYSNTLQQGLNVSTKYNKDYFDLPIVHLTEIKLIRAEAGAEIAASNPAALVTAIKDINDIMARAYNGISQNLPANAVAALVISTTRYERELELVGEGNRIQEIKRIGVRNGTNIDRRGSPWNCNGLILQFPKGEQDANAAFQMNIEGGCF